MNNKTVGIIVVVVVVIGAVAGFYLLNHKTTPTPTTTTSTTSATSTTTTSIAPQNNNVIMFYKYNSTYYVFMIPYTNDSGPAFPYITWWDVLHSQVVYYGYMGTYIRAEPVAITINPKPGVYEVFNIDLTSYGVPVYKLENGYAMVFAMPEGNYSFVQGEVYNATIHLTQLAFYIAIEYGGNL